MPLVLSCLIALCLMFPLTSFAQDPQEPAPPDQDIAVTNATPDPALAGSVPATPAPPAAAPAPNPPSKGSSSTAGTSSYVFPRRNLAHYWFEVSASPKAAGIAFFAASWGTWVTNSPSDWDGFSGWSKRFGSAAMANATNQGSLVFLSAAWDQDPRYYRCPCSGTGPRLKHALKMTFMSRNRSGDAVFAPPKLIFVFPGPVVTRNTIWPSRFGTSDGIRVGFFSLGAVAGWNVAREFFLKAKPW